MCGIVGWLGRPQNEVALRMTERLRHRGPDGNGSWWDERREVFLGNRRLMVIDPTEKGAQPMRSPSGRYVLTYNGAIVNHRALRRELLGKGFCFRGHSDTEVLVTAMDAWGLKDALLRLEGMFAFGLFDREDRCLWLVRDRLGIKPLYYAEQGGDFAFASELHALQCLPWHDDTLDKGALAAYFRFLTVPAPATIFRGARKLLPGSMLCWNGRQARISRISRYWELKTAAETGLANPSPCTRREAAEELERRLTETIRLHAVADVPVGVFLSGGLDSSAIAALLQAQSDHPVKTFNLGFDDPSHDESQQARSVAQHLGCEHQELKLTARDAIDHVPRMAALHDEPFADGSNIPTYLLSRFARRTVTVAISGDGGDEIFGGYPRYFWADRIQNLQKRLGVRGARTLGRALSASPSALWDGPISALLGERFAGSEGLSSRVQRFGAYLGSSPNRVYQDLLSAWTDPGELLGEFSSGRLGPDPDRFPNMKWADQMMAVDTESVLVDDFLTKVDRASMAASLEVRVPLLDHRLVEWCWRLPRGFKLAPAGDRGKLLLRDVLTRYLPGHLTLRPKRGFGMPMARWLRRELRPWAEDLLSESSIRKSGVLNASPVRRAWKQHLKGADRLGALWAVLMFLEWQRRGTPS